MPTNVYLVKAMVFPIVMYGCESCTTKKAECWRIHAFELWCWRRLLRVPWTGKKIKPVNPKGNQPWIFTGRTDAEAEAPTFWPPDGKNWFIGKDPDAGKDWSQGEKGTTEDDMVRWYHRLDGREFEQAPGVGDGQGSQMCCSPWGHKESHMTEWLRWTELCKPMDCSLLGSSVQGILQARILKWIAMVSSSGSSHPRDGNWVPY